MAWVTAGLKTRQIRLSIRSKLLIISAVLLVVPWMGVNYIQDMEDFLRVNQEAELLDRAKVVAAVLQGQPEVFRPRSVTLDLEPVKPVSHIYVRPLKTAVLLDGYMDDWLNYEDRARLVVSENTSSLKYRYYIGTYGKYLYAMFEVNDDQRIYRRTGSLSVEDSDHLKIVLTDRENKLHHYIITTISPGWVNAYRVEKTSGGWSAIAPELRIKGEWQETTAGYNLEIRIPLSLLGDKLGFFIADVDNKSTRKVERTAGSSSSLDNPGTIVIPSASLEGVLKRIARPASRTWVIDRQYRVLAVEDNLKQSVEYQTKDKQDYVSKVVRFIYTLLLKQPTHTFKDTRSAVSMFHGKAVQSALQGKPSVSWRNTPDDRVRIITASYPVMRDGKAIGAIAIEETSNAILLLQNRAMEILINLSVISFFITVIVLLGYASMLSIRIRRLRDQAENSISQDGKVSNSIRPSRSSDEIGDLSRSYADVLSRLAEYNRYLETMASKLSHELRTPITVVSSSLENLQNISDEKDKQTYIDRASEGMSRLSDILTRMSEATRLEQTLQSEVLQHIDICKLIENCVDAYRIANETVQINFENKNVEICELTIAPDLIAQMLDKIVSNAIEFHQQDTSVDIVMLASANSINLIISNTGPILPEKMEENLFESMVSVRAKRDSQPHLGLGLYIARMIVEFHQGIIEARNRQDESGVEIEISLPLDRKA